jgi:hypothetical protein
MGHDLRKNTFLDDVLEDSSPESTHHVDLVASVVVAPFLACF